MSVQANVDAIVNAINALFRDEEDMCTVQPTGSHERVQNVDQVKASVLACERARNEAVLPEIQVGDVDAFGECPIVVSGAFGIVTIRVTGDPLARYVKTWIDPQSKKSLEVAGSGPVESRKGWARLARWASTGKNKFVG